MGEAIPIWKVRVCLMCGASAVECLCITSASSAIEAVPTMVPRTAHVHLTINDCATHGCALNANPAGFVAMGRMR